MITIDVKNLYIDGVYELNPFSIMTDNDKQLL